MFRYEMIDVSGETGFSRSSSSCEGSICHYCYFLKINVRSQLALYDGCHDLMQKL